MTLFPIWNLITLLALAASSELAAAFPVARAIQHGQVLSTVEDAPKQGPDAATSSENYIATQSIESCMKNWDPGTHMTKDAWRQSCKRITEERLPYVKGKSDHSK